MTAVDQAGNTATSSVTFTLFHSTKVLVQQAEGIYSDTTTLRATVTDASGQRLRGMDVSFSVEDREAGTAVTNEQGEAVLSYKVTQAGAAGQSNGNYPLTVTVSQQNTDYYRSSQASGQLNVALEQASLQLRNVAGQLEGTVDIRAQVTEEADGKNGVVRNLPVQFDIHRVGPDGSLSVLEAVYGGDLGGGTIYRTDAQGMTSAAAALPAGLYEIKARLLQNGYYNIAEATATLAVYNHSSGELSAAGWLDLSGTEKSFFGESAKKTHLKAAFSYRNGKHQGSLRIHAEPKGLELTMTQPEWVIVGSQSAYVQGRAKDSQGSLYTIRLMHPLGAKNGADRFVSLTIWKGTDTGQTAQLNLLKKPFTGTIVLNE